MNDALIQQVERTDALLLGEARRMFGVVMDDGARSLRWKRRKPCVEPGVAQVVAAEAVESQLRG